MLSEVQRSNYAYREAYCVFSTQSKYFRRIYLFYNLNINIITYFNMWLSNRRILEIIISLFVFLYVMLLRACDSLIIMGSVVTIAKT